MGLPGKPCFNIQLRIILHANGPLGGPQHTFGVLLGNLFAQALFLCFLNAPAMRLMPVATSAPSELRQRKEKPSEMARSMSSSFDRISPAVLPDLRQAFTTLANADRTVGWSNCLG